MILKQYYLGCLAHASYLLGDEASLTAIVVDPQRDIQQYVADAERWGLKIRHVLTFHADFIAGHLELRDRCGASVLLAAEPRRNMPLCPWRMETHSSFQVCACRFWKRRATPSSPSRCWYLIDEGPGKAARRSHRGYVVHRRCWPA